MAADDHGFAVPHIQHLPFHRLRRIALVVVLIVMAKQQIITYLDVRDTLRLNCCDGYEQNEN